MFKKIITCVVFDIALMTSLTLGAKDNKPTLIAKLDVENKYRLAHINLASHTLLIKSVRQKKPASNDQTQAKVPM